MDKSSNALPIERSISRLKLAGKSFVLVLYAPAEVSFTEYNSLVSNSTRVYMNAAITPLLI